MALPDNHSEDDVQKEALEAVKNSFDELLDAYISTNGRILDTDRAKEMFPAYSISPESRRKYSSALYAPASKFIDQAFQALIAKHCRRGVPDPVSVVFTAGGPGSGKTALINTFPEFRDRFAVVMDGTLSNFDRAHRNIGTALYSGANVLVAFVFRPMEGCLRGVIDRALSDDYGRPTPLSVTIEKHRGAIDTLYGLSDLYPRSQNSRVSFFIAKFQEPGLPVIPLTTRDEVESQVQQIPLDQAVKTALSLEHEWDAIVEQRGTPQAGREDVRRALFGGLEKLPQLPDPGSSQAPDDVLDSPRSPVGRRSFQGRILKDPTEDTPPQQGDGCIGG